MHVRLEDAQISIGVLSEQTFGKEKLFVHPKLMTLLTRDSNVFASYDAKSAGQGRGESVA